MNKEILFKAKTTKKDNPKHEFDNIWIEGDLIRSGGKYYIHPIHNKVNVVGESGKIIVMHEVEENTICRYTGKKDKNGKKIWENDICAIQAYQISGMDGYFKVIWDAENARIALDSRYLYIDFDNIYDYECEVIGNIFDNTELLEVEER